MRRGGSGACAAALLLLAATACTKRHYVDDARGRVARARDKGEALAEIAAETGAPYAKPYGDVVSALRERIVAACPGGEGTRALALVVDTTESMSRFADALHGLGSALEAAGAAGCRVGVYVYRDVGAEYVARRLVAFDEPVDHVRPALATLTLKGGGDWPEQVWFALDMATAGLEETGLPGTVLLVADAPGHTDPAAASHVRGRLAGGRLRLDVLDVSHAEPPPPEPLALSPPDIASMLGADYVTGAPEDAGTLAAGAMRDAIAGGATDVVLIVPSAPSARRVLIGLAAAHDAAVEVGTKGGAFGIVRFGDLGHPGAAELAVRFSDPSGAVRALDAGLATLPIGAEPEDRTVVLQALRFLTTLYWTAGRARVAILVTDRGSDPDEAAVEAVKAWLAVPRTRLVIIGVGSGSGGR
jgi:hypothetical protein